ncbi:MAG: ABC transporter permease [Candidatus Syntrophosphaera sp.]
MKRIPAWDAVRSAFQSILNHKLRSLLTLTGIVIGVLAVVTMFSSVYALKALISRNMEGMGWDHSIVISADSPGSVTGPRSLQRAVRRASQSVKTINYEDYLALKENVPHKSSYAMVGNSAILRLGNESKQVNLRAVDAEYFVNKTYPILHGRYYNQYENDNLLPVAVLGYHFAREQYGFKNPVGKTLQLGDHRLKIIGVLKDDQLSSGNGMNFNTWERKEELSAVYVPLKYGASYFGTQKGLHMIYLQASSPEEFSEMKIQARQLLLARHSMYPNFSVMNVGEFLLKISNEINKYMEKWNVTLIAIASISLLVGGIGLFSTLLISIQERMTEIGIRKSVGATQRDIFYYFIFEAVSLAILGAILGIILSWVVLNLISKAINFPIYLPVQGVAMGLFFSFLVGVISGLYPAIKASRVDPIRAIYYFE